MSLHLFNTLTRRKETFSIGLTNSVSLYTCGPTVYAKAHIGNLRTYLFEDLLVRTLGLLGFEVNQVMNITDIDDKTLSGALKAGKSLADFTAPFKKAFFQDLNALNITPARHYPEATAFVSQMINMIDRLIDRGFAYVSDDQSVYFSVERFSSYGCLARLVPEKLKVGGSKRVEADEYDKQEASDFALWKSHDPKRDGNINWDSPWGKGRPGWHIECSAMAHHYHGPTLDIHAGGVDNIFPHHDNEIAQSQCIHQKPLARFWLHAEHLRVEGRKMSKSLGNYLALSDLTKANFDPLAFRLLLLQNHYRTPMNFTWDALKGATSALVRLQSTIKRLEKLSSLPQSNTLTLKGISESAFERFQAALMDDLNSASALAIVFETARLVNQRLDANSLTQREIGEFLSCYHKIDRVLGILWPKESGDISQLQKVPEQITNWVIEREKARKNRDWKLADSLRQQIEGGKFEVIDTPSGPKVICPRDIC